MAARLAVIAVATVAAACGGRGHVRAPAPPAAGISIAIYASSGAAASSYAVVDDRRWIDIASHQLVLEHVDPGAALASLVIEPYGAAPLRIGACERDRIASPQPAPERDEPASPTPMTRSQVEHRHLVRRLALRRLELARRGVRLAPEPPSPPPAPTVVRGPAIYAPIVHCAVDGPPGRYLVRVLYVSPALAYKAENDVVLTSAVKASVATQLAIQTPAWHERADVVLYDGMPGGEHPPVEVARGPVALDGSIAILSTPRREVAAEIRRVFDGATLADDIATNDPAWGRESHTSVWVWLELPKLRLPPGSVHVHVDLAGEGTREVDVVEGARRQDDEPGAPLRLPLWVDGSVHGLRQRFVDYADGEALEERFVIGVGNDGDAPREVWIEEHMRPARRRVIEHAWPARPAIVGDVARAKIVVRPGRAERIGFTARYEF